MQRGAPLPFAIMTFLCMNPYIVYYHAFALALKIRFWPEFCQSTNTKSQRTKEPMENTPAQKDTPSFQARRKVQHHQRKDPRDSTVRWSWKHRHSVVLKHWLNANVISAHFRLTWGGILAGRLAIKDGTPIRPFREGFVCRGKRSWSIFLETLLILYGSLPIIQMIKIIVMAPSSLYISCEPLKTLETATSLSHFVTPNKYRINSHKQVFICGPGKYAPIFKS